MYYHSSYQDSTRSVHSVATTSEIHTFFMLFNGIMFTFCKMSQLVHSLTPLLCLFLCHSLSLSLSLSLTHTHTHTHNTHTHTQHTHTQVSYTCCARFEVRTCLVGCYVVMTGNYLQVVIV
jgi:hypothetical protein